MSDKPTTPEDDEAGLSLLLAYFRQKQKDKFYGTIEVTMQAGEARHFRETRGVPAAAVASEVWAAIPDKVKKSLKDKFKGQPAFDVG